MLKPLQILRVNEMEEDAVALMEKYEILLPVFQVNLKEFTSLFAQEKKCGKVKRNVIISLEDRNIVEILPNQ